MRDGLPWFIPPPHLDPAQRPIRNGVHHAIDAARRAGQQMLFDLDHPTDHDIDPTNTDPTGTEPEDDHGT